ncbi:MAG: hypothetical protein HZB23_02310 [Deltaproteobacteria bacterium]|nr:hypothetical protein [Deltaproteobacteria bacterium]
MELNNSKITTGGILRYVKKAFLFHWNLLALGAGVVYGLLSGRPDVALPLVAAAEIVFLAGLATRPRFQDAVDAEGLKGQDQDEIADEAEATRLISALSQKDRRDFEELRSLCLELDRIGAREDRPEDVAKFQTDGVNRLLWIYLKLLFSKTALERYFKTVDPVEIENSVTRATERLAALGPESEDDEKEASYRKSLEDTRATAGLRLANHRKARDNHEFIVIELERLHGKIAGLAELGVGRQGPQLFSNEIDAAAATIRNTERAMDELSFLTGLSTDEREPPRLLYRAD